MPNPKTKVISPPEGSPARRRWWLEAIARASATLMGHPTDSELRGTLRGLIAAADQASKLVDRRVWAGEDPENVPDYGIDDWPDGWDDEPS